MSVRPVGAGAADLSFDSGSQNGICRLVLQPESLSVRAAPGMTGPVAGNLLPSALSFAQASFSGWCSLRVDGWLSACLGVSVSLPGLSWTRSPFLILRDG